MIQIQVPATSANLGPGYDSLGLALKLYNRVQLEIRSDDAIHIDSPIDDADRPSALEMLAFCESRFRKETGTKSRIGFNFSVHGDVPFSRGLGSSVTVRLGVVAGLNRLTNSGFSKQQLFQMVTDLEGHPDNAAPAVFGGFTASGMMSDESARCAAFSTPTDWRFVAWIPDMEINTVKARLLLPEVYPKSDVFLNLNRVALVTSGFASGDLRILQEAFEDRVHQPYRAQLLPEFYKVVQTSIEAGAVGGWLSGSGSTTMSLAANQQVAEVILAAWESLGLSGKFQILEPDNTGFQEI
jgi:homoserine kinase